MNKDIDALNILVALSEDAVIYRGSKAVSFRGKPLRPEELGVIIQESLERKDKIILETRRYLDYTKRLYETPQYIESLDHINNITSNPEYSKLLKEKAMCKKRLDELLEGETEWSKAP